MAPSTTSQIPSCVWSLNNAGSGSINPREATHHSLELHRLHQLVQFQDLIFQLMVEGGIFHDQ